MNKALKFIVRFVGFVDQLIFLGLTGGTNMRHPFPIEAVEPGRLLAATAFPGRPWR